MASSQDPVTLREVVPALLEFERAPGRYAVALREPRPLFEATRAVMQLAAGRPVEGLPPLKPGQSSGAVQQAARFFVRTVLLRPGVDHYNLLGLKPGFDPATLRDHYRLLIRMTHPDFADAGEAAWPADAASRINIANDVLGSAVKRAEYDASLAAAAAGTKPLNSPSSNPLGQALKNPLGAQPEPPAKPGEMRRNAPAPHATEAALRATRRRRKIALAAVGALACAGLLWLMTPNSSDGSLVAQRAGPAAPLTKVARSDGATASSEALPEVAQAVAQVQEALAAAEPTTPQPAAQGAQTLMAAGDSTAANAPGPKRFAMPPVESEIAGVFEAPPEKPGKVQGRGILRDPAVQTAADASSPAGKPKKQAQTPTQEQAQNNGKAAGAPPARSATAAATRHHSSGEAAKSAAKATASAPGSARSLAVAPDDSGRLTLGLDTHLTLAPSAATAAPSNGLTMAQVQPKIAQVLSGLRSGKGENVVRWLESEWRNEPAASAFLSQYQRMLGSESVLQLGRVQLRSRSVAELFVVDGVVELYLLDANAKPYIKELEISAHFLPKDGQPMLTQVVLKRP